MMHAPDKPRIVAKQGDYVLVWRPETEITLPTLIVAKVTEPGRGLVKLFDKDRGQVAADALYRLGTGQITVEEAKEMA